MLCRPPQPVNVLDRSNFSYADRRVFFASELLLLICIPNHSLRQNLAAVWEDTVGSIGLQEKHKIAHRDYMLDLHFRHFAIRINCPPHDRKPCMK